jgi:protein-tyrosine phosphatase
VATGIAYARDVAQFRYCTIEIVDTPESLISESFDECFAFIDSALKEGGCLVHCNAGGMCRYQF